MEVKDRCTRCAGCELRMIQVAEQKSLAIVQAPSARSVNPLGGIEHKAFFGTLRISVHHRNVVALRNGSHRMCPGTVSRLRQCLNRGRSNGIAGDAHFGAHQEPSAGTSGLTRRQVHTFQIACKVQGCGPALP